MAGIANAVGIHSWVQPRLIDLAQNVMHFLKLQCNIDSVARL